MELRFFITFACLLHLRPQTTNIFHETIDETDALHVWRFDERGAIVELHHRLLPLFIHRPVRQSCPIGIHCLGEVHPVLLHGFRHGSLLRILYDFKYRILVLFTNWTNSLR